MSEIIHSGWERFNKKSKPIDDDLAGWKSNVHPENWFWEVLENGA